MSETCEQEADNDYINTVKTVDECTLKYLLSISCRFRAVFRIFVWEGVGIWVGGGYFNLKLSLK